MAIFISGGVGEHSVTTTGENAPSGSTTTTYNSSGGISSTINNTSGSSSGSSSSSSGGSSSSGSSHKTSSSGAATTPTHEEIKAAYKEAYGYAPRTTSEYAQATNMATASKTGSSSLPPGTILASTVKFNPATHTLKDIATGQVIATNVVGYTTKDSQYGRVLGQVETQHDVAGSGMSRTTYDYASGKVTGYASDDVYASYETGKMFMRDTGQEANLLTERDYTAAKKAGLITSVPKDMAAQSEWYAAQELAYSKQAGALGLTTQMGQEYGEYTTETQLPGGGYEIAILPGAMGAESAIENALKQYGTLFTYANVEEKKPGVYTITQKDISENKDYSLSKEFGGLLSQSGISEIFLTDKMEVGIKFDKMIDIAQKQQTSNVLLTSEMTPGQLKAFQSYFGENLSGMLQGAQEQIFQIRSDQLGVAGQQSFDTGIKIEPVTDKAGLYLTGTEKWLTFEAKAPTKAAQLQNMLSEAKVEPAKPKEFVGPPSPSYEQQSAFAKLETRITNWDKALEDTTTKAWGNVEAAPGEYKAPEGAIEAGKYLAQKQGGMGYGVALALEYAPKEVTNLIAYGTERLVIDTTKGGIRAGEMFATAAVGFPELVRSGAAATYGAFEKNPFGGMPGLSMNLVTGVSQAKSETFQAPYSLMSKYPVETGLFAASFLIPWAGGAVGSRVASLGGAEGTGIANALKQGASKYVFGDYSAQAGAGIRLGTEAAVPIYFTAGMTQYEMQKGYDLPTAFGRALTTMALAGAGFKAVEAVGKSGMEGLHETSIKARNRIGTEYELLKGDIESQIKAGNVKEPTAYEKMLKAGKDDASKRMMEEITGKKPVEPTKEVIAGGDILESMKAEEVQEAISIRNQKANELMSEITGKPIKEIEGGFKAVRERWEIEAQNKAIAEKELTTQLESMSAEDIQKVMAERATISNQMMSEITGRPVEDIAKGFSGLRESQRGMNDVVKLELSEQEFQRLQSSSAVKLIASLEKKPVGEIIKGWDTSKTDTQVLSEYQINKNLKLKEQAKLHAKIEGKPVGELLERYGLKQKPRAETNDLIDVSDLIPKSVKEEMEIAKWTDIAERQAKIERKPVGELLERYGLKPKQKPNTDYIDVSDLIPTSVKEKMEYVKQVDIAKRQAKLEGTSFEEVWTRRGGLPKKYQGVKLQDEKFFSEELTKEQSDVTIGKSIRLTPEELAPKESWFAFKEKKTRDMPEAWKKDFEFTKTEPKPQTARERMASEKFAKANTEALIYEKQMKEQIFKSQEEYVSFVREKGGFLKDQTLSPLDFERVGKMYERPTLPSSLLEYGKGGGKYMLDRVITKGEAPKAVDIGKAWEVVTAPQEKLPTSLLKYERGGKDLFRMGTTKPKVEAEVSIGQAWETVIRPQEKLPTSLLKYERGGKDLFRIITNEPAKKEFNVGRALDRMMGTKEEIPLNILEDTSGNRNFFEKMERKPKPMQKEFDVGTALRTITTPEERLPSSMLSKELGGFPLKKLANPEVFTKKFVEIKDLIKPIAGKEVGTKGGMVQLELTKVKTEEKAPTKTTTTSSEKSLEEYIRKPKVKIPEEEEMYMALPSSGEFPEAGLGVSMEAKPIRIPAMPLFAKTFQPTLFDTGLAPMLIYEPKTKVSQPTSMLFALPPITSEIIKTSEVQMQPLADMVSTKTDTAILQLPKLDTGVKTDTATTTEQITPQLDLTLELPKLKPPTPPGGGTGKKPPKPPPIIPPIVFGKGYTESKKKKKKYDFSLGKPSGKKSMYSDLRSMAHTQLYYGAKGISPSLKQNPKLWKYETKGYLPTKEMLTLGGPTRFKVGSNINLSLHKPKRGRKWI